MMKKTSMRWTRVARVAMALLILSVWVTAAFGQCDLSPSAGADKSVPSAVKCLEYPRKDFDSTLLARRQLIFELHKLGKAAIPSLIENISNEKKIFAWLSDPMASGRRTDKVPTGLLSAYIVELILGNESLTSKKGDLSFFMLGLPSENYVYRDGTIRNSKKETISDDKLINIQKIYQEWWNKNKDEPIETLRDRWKKGERILNGTEFSWS